MELRGEFDWYTVHQMTSTDTLVSEHRFPMMLIDIYNRSATYSSRAFTGSHSVEVSLSTSKN